MLKRGLKLFKILYSGELKGIESEDILTHFSDLNIIAFYIPKNKRLYIWVGDDCSRALKNYIPTMRQRFSEEYPFLRVLRYITVESMDESSEFIRDIDISREDIHSKLKSKREEYQKHQEIVSQIKEFKNAADLYFENKQFVKAIESANEVIALAHKIEDEILIDDQRNLIDEANARLKAESALHEIREEKTIIKEKLYKVEQTKNEDKIIELHNHVKKFKERYQKYLGLPALENIRELLQKAENVWESYLKQKQNYETLISSINDLREKKKKTLEKGSLIKSYNYYEKIVSILGGKGDE